MRLLWLHPAAYVTVGVWVFWQLMENAFCDDTSWAVARNLFRNKFKAIVYHFFPFKMSKKKNLHLRSTWLSGLFTLFTHSCVVHHLSTTLSPLIMAQCCQNEVLSSCKLIDMRKVCNMNTIMTNKYWWVEISAAEVRSTVKGRKVTEVSGVCLNQPCKTNWGGFVSHKSCALHN